MDKSDLNCTDVARLYSLVQASIKKQFLRSSKKNKKLNFYQATIISLSSLVGSPLLSYKNTILL